jgi:2,3-dihydroxy-2,3-dihydrophenylpropionate dehydrogenase
VSGSLAGQAVLVAGAGSGIGRAALQAYLQEGATATVLERSDESFADLDDDFPGMLAVVRGDATVPADVELAVGRATAGGRPLHHLTCCVGVFDQYASLRSMSADELLAAGGEIWRGNVLSSLLLVRGAFPALAASRGSVTLTLSGSAFYAEGGGVLYGASKWALRGAVAHLSKDLAPEVRVNAVAPGGTTGTALAGLSALGQQATAADVPDRDARIESATALGVLPTPEDHAAAYVYLADPRRARVVTGAVINTDGGRR